MKESLTNLITNFIGIFNSFLEGVKAEAAKPKKAVVLAVTVLIGWQLITTGGSSLLDYGVKLVSSLSLEQIVGVILMIVLLKDEKPKS